VLSVSKAVNNGLGRRRCVIAVRDFASYRDAPRLCIRDGQMTSLLMLTRREQLHRMIEIVNGNGP